MSFAAVPRSRLGPFVPVIVAMAYLRWSHHPGGRRAGGPRWRHVRRRCLHVSYRWAGPVCSARIGVTAGRQERPRARSAVAGIGGDGICVFPERRAIHVEHSLVRARGESA